MKNTGSRWYIIRIDNNKTEGWRVIVPGPAGRKTFTDLRYQGRSQALMAAQKFRDGLITRRKSASGRYGVSLLRLHNVAGAISSIKWMARFPVDGRSKTKSFNLMDHGYEDAWRLAMEERVKHGGLPAPKAPPPMPEWVKEWLLSTPTPTYRGTFGHIGVNLVCPLQNGKRYMVWKAEWSIAGQSKNKSWSLHKYGYEGAWRLAAEERARHDGLPSPTEPPPMPRWVREWLASTPANKSGRTGVFLIRRNGYLSWKAWFRVGGVMKFKCWSLHKYGYEGAWRQAVAWREQCDGLPSPTEPPPMPEWVKEWLLAQPRKKHG